MLLLGRSGSGKTTIALFRCLAIFQRHQRPLLEAAARGIDPDGSGTPKVWRQMFITCSSVLRNEVRAAVTSLIAGSALVRRHA